MGARLLLLVLAAAGIAARPAADHDDAAFSASHDDDESTGGPGRRARPPRVTPDDDDDDPTHDDDDAFLGAYDDDWNGDDDDGPGADDDEMTAEEKMKMHERLAALHRKEHERVEALKRRQAAASDAAKDAGAEANATSAGPAVVAAFHPPFKQGAGRYEGHRTLESSDALHAWQLLGDASVRKYFVRLASPGLSLDSRGALWSARRFNAKEAAVTLAFRVAGPADDHAIAHGSDPPGGAAVWLTNRPFPGADPGLDVRATDQARGRFAPWRGVGVVASHARPFGDARVALVGPDGAFLGGCAARVRFQNTRADYAPSRNATRVRIKVAPAGPALVATVRVDDGAGFRFCVSTPLPDALDAKWLEGAYAGVTAASAAGDAVDVVKLAVASRKSHAHDGEELHDALDRLDVAYGDTGRGALSFEERFRYAERDVNLIAANFDTLAAAVEHSALRGRQKVDHAIDEARARADAETARVLALEEKVAYSALDKLEHRLAALERKVADTRLGASDAFSAHHEEKLEARVTREGERVLLAAGLGGPRHSVRGAFALTVVAGAQLALLWYAYTIYADLRKHHLL